jgi:hypothetical protein
MVTQWGTAICEFLLQGQKKKVAEEILVVDNAAAEAVADMDNAVVAVALVETRADPEIETALHVVVVASVTNPTLFHKEKIF